MGGGFIMGFIKGGGGKGKGNGNIKGLKGGWPGACFFYIINVLYLSALEFKITFCQHSLIFIRPTRNHLHTGTAGPVPSALLGKWSGYP